MTDTLPLSPSPLPSGEAPQPTSTLAKSDQRLQTMPRFKRLRDYLHLHGEVEPSLLAQLLDVTWSEHGMALVPLLLQAGLITNEESQTAKERKRRKPDTPLWQLFQELDILGEETLALGMALTNQIPFIFLYPAAVDPLAAKYMDGRMARQWQICPVRLIGEELLLATVDPKETDIDQLSSLTGRRVRLIVASRPAILTTIAALYGSLTQREPRTGLEELDLRSLYVQDEGDELHRIDLNAIQLANRILFNAIRKGASDIHLTPEEHHLQIDLRIDGKLAPLARLPSGQETHLISRFKVISGMDIAERRLPQDGNIRVRLPDRIMDVRVSDIPSVRGETLVLRLLDHQQGLVRIDQLGFFPEDQERLRRAVILPYGMILLTGPTGSGKSTTLRSALEFVQQQEKRHILTVEDPVEVKMAGITQVQVNPKIEFTFARALRNFLRHDPDVIMVGEIRDGETAKIAVQAALTGHLVLSTLHTNDAPGAITRLIDMGVEPFLVSSAVTMVIAQRLIRLLCVVCRQSERPNDDEIRTLRSLGYQGTAPELLYRKRGCAQCNGSGYRGRTILYEMWHLDEELKGMVSQRATATELRRTAVSRGFHPLIVSGVRKVLAGETSLAEVATFLDTWAGLG